MPDTSEHALERLESLRQELRRLERSLLAPATEQAIALPLDALVFWSGSYQLALPVKAVNTVIPMVLVAPVPQAPEAMRGTIDFHGELLPVVDLAIPLTGDVAPLSPDQFLVVVDTDRRRFALSTTRIEEVRRFGGAEVDEGAVTTALPSFVRCMLRGVPRGLPLLDPAGLLAASELDALGGLADQLQAAAGAGG